MNSMAARATFSGSRSIARLAGLDHSTEYRLGGAVTAV
jgi:hypothetical protein